MHEKSTTPTYKDFLRVSNGWLRTTPFIGRIRPVEEVEWFRIENKQWVDVYSQDGSNQPDAEYYVYDPEGAGDHRAEHMAYLLQISDVDDGVYLLNPEAVTPNGEWEAWFFANWIPGAVRFPSFAHLMLGEYLSFARLESVDLTNVPMPQLDEVPPSVARKSAMHGLRSTVSEETPGIEELIHKMSALDDHVRDKAARTLAGMLVGRLDATRRPELVERLTDLFYASDDADVRSVCVDLLTEIAEDGAAPKPLFDALSDVDPGVVLTGIVALTYFPNDLALKPLCRFIELRRNEQASLDAISALGVMENPKAIPTLAGVLLDTNNQFDQSFVRAAMALVRCGQSGFDTLVSALEHKDPRVRLAAVIGLDVSGNEEASVYLERALTDPDAGVRRRAKMGLGISLF